MRRASLGGGAAGGGFAGAHSTGPLDASDLLFFGPWGALNPSGDLVLETARWRERMFEERAGTRPGRSGFYQRLSGIAEFMFPGGMGGGGGLALNQLLVVMDGIDNPPFFKRFFTSKSNTFLDATYIIPRRIRQAVAAAAGSAPAQGADLLHRRHQRAYRAVGSGPDPAGAHGPARLVPNPDATGSPRRLRPVHQQGRPRHRARHPRPPGRDRPHHERLLAGDDRPGLLDGAHDRPPLGPRRFRMGRSRGSDDDARVGHGDRGRVCRGGKPCRRDPRGGPRGQRSRVHEGHRVDAPLDPHARRLARPPPGGREGGALQQVPERGLRQPDLDARRDGGRACLLRGELARRGRRRLQRDGADGDDGGPVGDGPAAVHGCPARRRDRGAGATARARALRAHRPADHEPHRRRPDDRRPGLERARRPVQAPRRRADPRAGVRDGPQPRPPQPPRDRARRRQPDREEGDLRKRSSRPARVGHDPDPRGRPERRDELAQRVLRERLRPAVPARARRHRCWRPASERRAHGMP